jgi:hypothetical protein
MDVDIGIVEIVAVIVESTTGYLVVFLPLIVFIAGILLAYVFSSFLIELMKFTFLGAGKEGESWGQYRRRVESDNEDL